MACSARSLSSFSCTFRCCTSFALASSSNCTARSFSSASARRLSSRFCKQKIRDLSLLRTSTEHYSIVSSNTVRVSYGLRVTGIVSSNTVCYCTAQYSTKQYITFITRSTCILSCSMEASALVRGARAALPAPLPPLPWPAASGQREFAPAIALPGRAVGKRAPSMPSAQGKPTRICFFCFVFFVCEVEPENPPHIRGTMIQYSTLLLHATRRNRGVPDLNVRGRSVEAELVHLHSRAVPPVSARRREIWASRRSRKRWRRSQQRQWRWISTAALSSRIWRRSRRAAQPARPDKGVERGRGAGWQWGFKDKGGQGGKERQGKQVKEDSSASGVGSPLLPFSSRISRRRRSAT